MGRTSYTPRPEVDQVISLPPGWAERSKKRSLRYFIPEWDDLVDPHYDFLTDTHSGGTGDWSNQVYAHQMLEAPAWDGLLVSRVVAEKGKRKARRINELGVHRYLRVPRQVPIMGDCGAFGYVKEHEPPYSIEDVLDYYTRLDFDLGVSVDHLVIGGDEAEKRRRWELTVHNAEVFLGEHRSRQLPWTPVGAVQGWDPASYAEGARRTLAMGYEWIALGGLVRTRTPGVLEVLEAVKPVLKPGIKVHLFGLGRIEAMVAFQRLGVTSADSASWLRQAWMRTKTSYMLGDQAYAALRIPQTSDAFIRRVQKARPGVTAEALRSLEAEALRAVRAFDAGQASVDEALAALMAYDPYATTERIDMAALYRRTLTEAPWKRCGCPICEAAGVEVIVFRGNNRNRRRGFHNTREFYRLLGEELAAEN